MLELTTKRLHLRPFKPADRDAFARMSADRDVMQYLPGPQSRTQSDAEVDQYLADFHNHGFSLMVAEDRHTAAFIGTMGLRLMQDVLPKIQQPAVQIDFRLHRDFHRLGLATEGGHALLRLAFTDFFLDEVIAVVAIANQPARGLLKELGMTHRTDLEYNNPRFPAQHLYAPHTVYQITNPDATPHLQPGASIFRR